MSSSAMFLLPALACTCLLVPKSVMHFTFFLLMHVHAFAHAFRFVIFLDKRTNHILKELPCYLFVT
jgi:hypothetical protein